ncbi:MAG TPA: glycine zipper family protein, partial [Stellaceae bacterium]
RMKAQAVIAALALLGGCVSPPIGPTVAVLPAPGKPLEKFAEEDAYCREYARQQVALVPEQVDSQLIGSAVVGTLLGAGLGAAVGRGPGAAFGAATGTLIGTGMASGNAAWAQMTIQQRYDVAYMQCMYAKGNQVPGYTVVGTAPPPPLPPPVR